MDFFLILALLVPAAVAAPVYQTEMSFTPFQKNMAHEVEDRINNTAVNELAAYAFFVKVAFLFFKGQFIFYIICVTNPRACIVPNFKMTDFHHMYETLEAPHKLAATEMIMSSLSAQNVVPFSLLDLTSADTKSDTPFITLQQNPLWYYRDLKVTPVTQTQMTTQHNIEFQRDTIRGQNLHPTFPVHTLAPYSKFRWPMYYPNSGRILHPYSDFFSLDTI